MCRSGLGIRIGSTALRRPTQQRVFPGLARPDWPSTPALTHRPLGTERCRPTTCQTQLTAGLPSPPSASSAEPTRRRASTCASVRSSGPEPPGSRTSGMQRTTSKRAMVNCAWKSRAASCISRVIVPARSMMPSVSTVRWWTTGRPSGSAS